MLGCKEKKSLKGVIELVQVFGECLPLGKGRKRDGDGRSISLKG